jgi:hypothetical protein
MKASANLFLGSHSGHQTERKGAKRPDRAQTLRFAVNVCIQVGCPSRLARPLTRARDGALLEGWRTARRGDSDGSKAARYPVGSVHRARAHPHRRSQRGSAEKGLLLASSWSLRLRGWRYPMLRRISEPYVHLLSCRPSEPQPAVNGRLHRPPDPLSFCSARPVLIARHGRCPVGLDSTVWRSE